MIMWGFAFTQPVMFISGLSRDRRCTCLFHVPMLLKRFEIDHVVFFTVCRSVQRWSCRTRALPEMVMWIFRPLEKWSCDIVFNRAGCVYFERSRVFSYRLGRPFPTFKISKHGLNIRSRNTLVHVPHSFFFQICNILEPRQSWNVRLFVVINTDLKNLSSRPFGFFVYTRTGPQRRDYRRSLFSVKHQMRWLETLGFLTAFSSNGAGIQWPTLSCASYSNSEWVSGWQACKSHRECWVDLSTRPSARHTFPPQTQQHHPQLAYVLIKRGHLTKRTQSRMGYCTRRRIVNNSRVGFSWRSNSNSRVACWSGGNNFTLSPYTHRTDWISFIKYLAHGTLHKHWKHYNVNVFARALAFALWSARIDVTGLF